MNLLTAAESWESTRLALKAWKITSYVVEEDRQALEVKDGVLYISPEFESVVNAMILENTHESEP